MIKKTENNKNKNTEAAAVKEKKGSGFGEKLLGILKFIVTPKVWRSLIVRCAVLLALPYAYLWICGLIFDLWLGNADAVPFIFWSLVSFWGIDLVLIVINVINFIRNKARRKARKGR